jgi:hypothetical protein
MNNKMIWYVSYGSNILFERFQYYILGGVYPGNGKYYAGCTDRQLPSKSLPVIIPYAMYFGNQSGSWGGTGVAFLDDKTPGFTIGRMYLITEEQFQEIQDQECSSPEWYGKTVELGEYMRVCLLRRLQAKPGIHIMLLAKGTWKPLGRGLRR